jgi:hypothetical protein
MKKVKKKKSFFNCFKFFLKKKNKIFSKEKESNKINVSNKFLKKKE